MQDNILKMYYRQARQVLSRQYITSTILKTLVCIESFVLFFTHRTFYTDAFAQKLLHTGAFTYRDFYTQTLLHTDASTHKRFHTHTTVVLCLGTRFETIRNFTSRSIITHYFTSGFDDPPSFHAKGLRAAGQNRNFT